MNSDEIKLVQKTFEQISPKLDYLAAEFYSNLFKLDPSLRKLFKSNILEQGRKLMRSLATIVNGLNQVEAILPTIQKLGINHLDYGVKNEHYDVVGMALLETLQNNLGEAYTPQVKVAWEKAFNMIADTMKKAAANSYQST